MMSEQICQKFKMGRPRKTYKTRMARLYDDDIQDIKLRFPKTSLADFFHIAVKTNTWIQVEAALRGKNKKNVKK